MFLSAKFEIIGPATLFILVLTAESAAYALALYPSSPTLWYINLEVFNVFQESHYLLSSYISISYFQLVFVGLPLFITGCCGLIFKQQLALATASSLSLIFVCFIWCTWLVSHHSLYQSLTFPYRSMDARTLLGGVLLITNLLSCVISHMSFLRSRSGPSVTMPVPPIRFRTNVLSRSGDSHWVPYRISLYGEVREGIGRLTLANISAPITDAVDNLMEAFRRVGFLSHSPGKGEGRGVKEPPRRTIAPVMRRILVRVRHLGNASYPDYVLAVHRHYRVVSGFIG
jgi:hypothetical protein